MSQQTGTDNTVFRKLAGAFVSPAQFDFWSRHLGSTHAWSRCYARVIARRIEAENTLTLRMMPNSNFDGFSPGQHVNLTTAIDGQRITRSYSFSNTPDADGWVEITVRRDPLGQMSNWLFNHAQDGTVLELERVFGAITSETFGEQPLLLLAGGSGITPLMSLLREQASVGMPRLVTLVYWERNDRSFCFAQELDEIADRFDHFNLHKIATRQIASRRISSAQLRALDVEIGGSQVLACGSSAFVEQARQCTATVVSGFQSEAFTPRPITAAGKTERKYTVELLSSGRSIEVSNQQPLLIALEQQGVTVQAGCRMGICNTCSCKKVNGHTRHADSAVNDSNTSSHIRLCVTSAASDLQLAI